MVFAYIRKVEFTNVCACRRMNMKAHKKMNKVIKE